VCATAENVGACVLAATEVYVGMTTDRADRPAFSTEEAAAELRRLVSEGVLEPRATSAVLAAAGHGEPATPAPRRLQNPGGLSRREIDVLELAARGLTTKERSPTGRNPTVGLRLYCFAPATRSSVPSRTGGGTESPARVSGSSILTVARHLATSQG
jgi:hypothetical protein